MNFLNFFEFGAFRGPLGLFELFWIWGLMAFLLGPQGLSGPFGTSWPYWGLMAYQGLSRPRGLGHCSKIFSKKFKNKFQRGEGEKVKRFGNLSSCASSLKPLSLKFTKKLQTDFKKINILKKNQNKLKALEYFSCGC